MKQGLSEAEVARQVAVHLLSLYLWAKQIEGEGEGG